MGKNLKRCRSVSEGAFNVQCEKRRGHTWDEAIPTHQNGPIVWHGPEPLNIKPAPATFGTSDIPLGGGPSSADRRKGMTDHTVNLTGRFDGKLDDVIDKHEARRKQGHRVSFVAKDEAQAFEFDLPTAPPEHQLTEWWIQQAEDEAARTVPKAIEYSSTDLTDIGRDLARCMGREVDDEEAAELGVFFYVRGKMARWVGSVISGDRVSDDTLFDIGVYVRMAQRIREAGNWPGVDFTEPVPESASPCNHIGGHLASCDQRDPMDTYPNYPNRSAG